MRGYLYALAVMVMASVVATAAPAVEREVPRTQEQVRLSFAPVVEQTAPAVVNIYARRMVEERVRSPLFRDPFFERFFGGQFGFDQRRRREQRSLGSGVILDPDGLIVTNEHVVSGAQEITVVLADRREFDAEIAVTDDRTDLAVLRVDTRGEALPALSLGDPDSLKVGDLVLAIGNPFGVGQTVTGGIVSALARTAVGISDYNFFIQTDAAINPGNSGGALVTLDGELVGINTAIVSRSGGSVGIGFAIPATMVRGVLESVRGGAPIARPWLGMTGQSVAADLAEGLGLDRPGGAVVVNIYNGGPAERAGLERGDVILRVAGRPVEDLEALRFRVATGVPGEDVDLEVHRPGEGRFETRLPLELPPEEPPRNETTLDGRQPLAGAKVANLSPALAAELNRPGDWSGVIILDVARGSAAARMGFRSGDVVLSVNEREIARVEELQTALLAAPARWAIRYRRGGRLQSITIGA